MTFILKEAQLKTKQSLNHYPTKIKNSRSAWYPGKLETLKYYQTLEIITFELITWAGKEKVVSSLILMASDIRGYCLLFLVCSLL